jgi:hypothetical protein
MKLAVASVSVGVGVAMYRNRVPENPHDYRQINDPSMMSSSGPPPGDIMNVLATALGMNRADLSYNGRDHGIDVLGEVTFLSGQSDLESFVQYALSELRQLYHRAQQAGISMSLPRPDYLNYEVDLDHVVAESLVTAQMEETIANNLRQANESFKQQLAVRVRELERQMQIKKVVSTAITKHPAQTFVKSRFRPQTVLDTKMIVEDLREV